MDEEGRRVEDVLWCVVEKEGEVANVAKVVVVSSLPIVFRNFLHLSIDSAQKIDISSSQ